MNLDQRVIKTGKVRTESDHVFPIGQIADTKGSVPINVIRLDALSLVDIVRGRLLA